MSSMKDWTTARVSKNVRRQAKRLEMLRAAARLFSDHGFHETSLDKLSDAIGAKKPTLYHYLGNKEQMVFECLKIGIEDVHQAAEHAQCGPGTRAERLCAFLERLAAVCIDDFGRCAIQVDDKVVCEEKRIELRALKDETRTLMLGLIEDGMADGSIARSDPVLLLHALVGALNWPARSSDPTASPGSDNSAAKLVSQLAHGFLPR